MLPSISSASGNTKHNLAWASGKGACKGEAGIGNWTHNNSTNTAFSLASTSHARFNAKKPIHIMTVY